MEETMRTLRPPARRRGELLSWLAAGFVAVPLAFLIVGGIFTAHEKMAAGEIEVASVSDRAALARAQRGIPSTGTPAAGNLAAAATPSFLDRAAGAVYRTLCPLFGCAEEPLVYTPSPSLTVASVVPTNSEALFPLPTDTSPGNHPTSSVSASAPVAYQTIEQHPVVERTIERIVQSAPLTASGAVTEAALDQKLAALDSSLRHLIFQNVSYPASLPASGGTVNNIALSQRIDSLSGTTIENPTITGGSITAASITGTITSAIDSVLATIENLTVAELLATNATTTNLTVYNPPVAPAYTATSTATSTFVGGIATARINASGTSTLAGIALTGTDCSSYGNGGTLTTDAFGNVVCAADDGGAGSGVAGANTQIQFNDGGSFGANASFTFDKTAGRLAVTNASTTNVSATYASSTQGFFGSLSIGNLTGFLKATAGALGTALVNLASDVTGILPVASGGTGWANVAASAIPYGNGTGALATTTAGTAGYVLAYLGGVPAWTATTTFSAPLAYANGAVSMPAASGSTNGYLTSADWTTFNGKLASVTADAPLSGSGTSGSHLTLDTSGTWSGNAGTATKLETARTINGVGFDGTGNITISAASSTLLSDTNTFSGNTTLSNATTSLLFVKSLLSSPAATFGAATATSTLAVFGPASFGATATSSFSAAGALTLSAPLALSSGGTGTTTAPQGQLLYGGGSSYQSVATTSLTASGVLSLSNPVSVIGAAASALTLIGGSNGQTLAWNSGAPTWVATTTFTAGTGISLAQNGNNWTIAASGGGGGGIEDPFTHPVAGQSATTSLVLLSGAASSTQLSAYKAYFGATATSTFDSAGVPSFPLTGLLQGKGAGVNIGVITDSSTIGQVLRVTGASTYAWGALDLSDSDAITGDLPFANLAQVSANRLLGNPTGATANVSEIATSTLFGTGSASQALAWNNGSPSWVATTTFSAGSGISLTQNGNNWTIAATGGGGGIADPFTHTSYAGQTTSATSSTLWLTGSTVSLAASSSVLTYASSTMTSTALASTTNLYISSIASGSLLKTTTGGQMTAAAASTDYAPATAGSSILLANGSGGFSSYAGTSCTNQFVRSINGAGVATCVSVSLTSDITGTLRYGNGGTGTTTAPQGQLLYGGATSYQSVATTSLTASGVLSLSNPISVIGPSASALSLTGGSNGQSLAWSNGAPAWVATTTLSAGTGISLSYGAGAWTVTNTGAGFPFTSTTNFGATVNATSTALLLSGGLQASSTVRFGALGVDGQFLYDSSTGKLGLGTSTPWARLSISTASQQDGSLPLFAISSTTNASLLTVLGTGNVGIGTTIPQYEMDIVGGARITGDFENLMFRPATVDGRMQIQWADEGTDVVSLDVHGDPHNHIELYTYSPSAATLIKRWAVNYNEDNAYFTTTGGGIVVEGQSTVENAAGGDPRIRFTGTKGTSLRTDLRMYDDKFQITDVDNGQNVRLSIDVDDGSVGIASTSPWGLLSINPNGVTGPSFVIGSSTATSFLVTNGGNVGIGTTTPGSRLDLYDSTPVLTLSDSQQKTWSIGDGFGTLSFRSTDASAAGARQAAFVRVVSDEAATTPSGALIFGTSPSNTVASERLRITGTGNVGIATTTPWRKFSVTGTVGFDGLTAATGAGSLCLSANKEVVYNSGSDACLSSTRATKHDIAPLAFDALALVEELQPVSFVYNEGDGRTRWGFIAEDAASVDPRLATYDASSSISGIDDRSFIALLTAAMQKLIATVASFADHFTTRDLTFTRASGDDLTVEHLHAGEACLPKSDGSEVCITGDQLSALLSQSAAAGFANPTPDPAAPPVLDIQGNNPAHINIGDTYNDLGARISGPTQADTNLGIHLFLDGIAVPSITLDTREPGEHVIDYVATNAAGTSTSTRTVIIEAPQEQLPLPTAATFVATTTASTTTLQ